MTIKIAVLAGYGLAILLVGWVARRQAVTSPTDYFLAGRGLGQVVFLGTMAATNFSAFTVFGASGAGYRDGLAFYPIVGFGTGFMALTFWFLGRRVWEQGLETKALTPAELIRKLYGSPGLSALMAVIMIVYTLPYIALQPMAAGYALEALLGLDYFAGAALVTGLIVLYTLRGGLRSVAWTDVFQGLTMIVLLFLALVMVAHQVGGLGQASRLVLAEHPKLFSRPGGLGAYSPGIWFSFIFLWFFCDPMFPQLFQRFLAARDERSLRATTLAYPLVCSLVFLAPVTIGVLGRLSHPGLTGPAADKILPLLAADLPGEIMGSLVVICGLAALMSTLDSQLLTLSSIFSQDLYPFLSHRRSETSVWPGRICVVLLAAAGLALAAKPPATILAIASQAFTGLAVLFPAVFLGLSPRWRSTPAAWASILAGQATVLGCFFKLIPTMGFLPVVPVMAVSFGAYLAGAWLTQGRFRLKLPRSPYFYVFLVIFVLGLDFWRWGERPVWLLGAWPDWVVYFWALSAVQTAATWGWVRAR